MTPSRARDRALLLPKVLCAPERKATHGNGKHPPSRAAPPPWKLYSVPHSGVYASLATFKTIPKTDKKRKKNRKKKPKRQVPVHVYFSVDGTAQAARCRPSAGGCPLPGAFSLQHTPGRTLPALQPRRAAFFFLRFVLNKKKKSVCVLRWDEGSQASLQRGPLPLSRVLRTRFYVWFIFFLFVCRVGFVPFKALLQRWM